MVFSSTITLLSLLAVAFFADFGSSSRLSVCIMYIDVQTFLKLFLLSLTKLPMAAAKM